MGIKKIKYEHSEKFRAHTFRFVGYAMCTPLCANIFQYLTSDSKCKLIASHPLISISLFISGFVFATLALGIMVGLDRELANNV